MKTMIRMYLAAVFCLCITTGLAGNNANITNCCPVPSGFMVEWIPGGEAVVKWSPDLGTPFTDLSGTLSAGQGSYIDTAHGSDNKCFYYVELLTPGGMVLIPAGNNSGTNPLAAGESYYQYYPSSYSLSVSAFYMDQTEVTKAHWDEVYNWAVAHDYQFSNPGSGKASNHPVLRVNWHDCVKWCNARSQMEGKIPCYTVSGSTYKTGQSDPDCNLSAIGYRLPTIEEWEYVARGGLHSKRFPWGDTINHSNANYRANGSAYSYDTSPYTTNTYHPDYNDGTYPYTSPVGSFAANGYGLYDMAGNVMEWCTDWAPGYEGSMRAFRGGGWDDFAMPCRTGNRFGLDPSFAGRTCGLRTVLPAE